MDFDLSAHTGANDTLDILAWWRSKSIPGEFPRLSKVAALLLAVPASTVVVEQTFSQGGNVLSKKRSRLLPDSLEAQVCLGDWLKAEARKQKNITKVAGNGSSDDNEEEGEDDASTVASNQTESDPDNN